jgi:DNA-binding response OmpR family regulator
MPSRPVQTLILLISDYAEVHATGAARLRLQGYQVLTAANGPEAEALGQRLGLEHLDLVILDLPGPHTPQVRAEYPLLQRWGAQAPHLPFMLISDGPLPDRFDPPVVWWLVKPLMLDTLLAVVRDILDA